MRDLRDVLERGTGGFDPDPDRALERTLRRAGRRSRRRRLVAAGTTLLVTAAILGGLWTAWLSGPPAVRPAVRPVAVATIPIGAIEGRPVFGEGRLWVAAGGGVHGIDPAAGEIAVTIEDVTAPVAVGDGSLWAIRPGGPPSLVRIDPLHGTVDQAIPIPARRILGPDLDPHPVAVASYRGEVLVVLEGTVVARIDPETERIRWEWWATDQTGPVLEMTADGDALWMRHPEAVSVRAPRSHSVFATPARIRAVAPSGRTAWAIFDGAAQRVGLGSDGADPRRIVELPPVSDAVVVDGRLWVVAGGGDGPWEVRAYDPSTGEPAGTSLVLGSGDGEGPRIAFGAGLLWVTHPVGDSVIAVDPSGETPPDPDPRVTEEPEPEAGCPPPDLEPTWFPPGLAPTTPQPGLGGGAGGSQPFPSAIHYGDSPGPDGGPAPFITILVWTADDHEVGPPHIWPVDARRSGTPVEVLGTEGHLVGIEGGWGAIFTLGDPPCNGYEVTSYGVPRADLRRFLEGLSRRSDTEDPRPLPSPTDELRSEEVGDGEYRFWPRSASVEPGVPYVFDTGHCGLAHLTDFDGSLWDPLPDAPRRFLINQSLGTMTLTGDDEALYEASTGERVRLQRIDGPVVRHLCS